MDCRSRWCAAARPPCGRRRSAARGVHPSFARLVGAVDLPVSPSSSSVADASRFGDVVFFLFLCVQATDGIFTYLGIVGIGWTEGNPLIAWYMNHFGVGPIVAAAKLVAVGCAIVLHLLEFHRVLAFLPLVYVSMAIVPWSFVLFVLH